MISSLIMNFTSEEQNMSERIIIVGGVAGGASVATSAKTA